MECYSNCWSILKHVRFVTMVCRMLSIIAIHSMLLKTWLLANFKIENKAGRLNILLQTITIYSVTHDEYFPRAIHGEEVSHDIEEAPL